MELTARRIVATQGCTIIFRLFQKAIKWIKSILLVAFVIGLVATP